MLAVLVNILVTKLNAFGEKKTWLNFGIILHLAQNKLCCYIYMLP